MDAKTVLLSEGVDVSKYRDLVAGLFNKACRFYMLDARINDIAESGDIGEDDVDTLRLVVKELLSENSTPTSTVNHVRFNASRKAYYTWIMNHSRECVGAAIIACNWGDSEPNEGLDRTLTHLLTHIAQCVRSEYNLNAELNSMTHELCIRYDELNLVYDVDEQITTNASLLESLDNLTTSCRTHFRAGAVFLLLPEQNIRILKHNPSCALVQHTTLNQIEQQALPVICDTGQVIICNTLESTEGLLGDRYGKIIITPVLRGAKESVGVLAVLNHPGSQDFSNSDKNLLEVMAKKVTQILQTSYDSLTGLYNRSVYEEHVKQAVRQSKEDLVTHVLLDIDIDDLQVINDTAGYEAGDSILKQVATIVKKCIRSSDSASRIGDDEFGILLNRCSLETGVKIAEKVKFSLANAEFVWNNALLKISATIGAAVISPDTLHASGVISEAEVARNAAKDIGKNRVEAFKKDDIDFVSRKNDMGWVRTIKDALRDDKFCLYAQPIVSLCGNTEPVHFELLLRMKGENGECIAPGMFIPAAERFHIMADVDKWVVVNAFNIIEKFCLENPGIPMIFSINLSGQSINEEDFLDFTIQLLGSLRIPMGSICFEITESAAIARMEQAMKFINMIKKLGCHFSLDDFGTGLSSFSYLKNLDVSFLKIDGSFIREIHQDPVSAAMVSAINQVGRIMGVKTIAEYVENNEILEKLKNIGVDFAQGYGVGMPQPLHDQLKKISS